jgi:hypothetical protein
MCEAHPLGHASVLSQARRVFARGPARFDETLIERPSSSTLPA